MQIKSKSTAKQDTRKEWAGRKAASIIVTRNHDKRDECYSTIPVLVQYICDSIIYGKRKTFDGSGSDKANVTL